MTFFDQGIEVVKPVLFVMDFGVHRAETRWEHHGGIPNSKPASNDVVKKWTAYLLSGGVLPSVGGAEFTQFTPSGGKTCNFRCALHQNKKTKHSHLQTATSSKNP